MSQESVAIESWTWYSIVMLVVVARYISRYLLVGSIKKFSAEDYLMIVVLCTYTVLIALLNVVINVSTNLILPEDLPNLTAQSIAERTYGSKLVIVVEQMMCATIWLCKACLLMMYFKLTFGLKANMACKIVGCYVAGTYVVMEILYFFVWCRPFRDAWLTPTPKQQCATQTHHLLTNLVFNLSSDCLILGIPLPLLVKSQLPLHRKIVLIFLFSLGSFVMLSAILSKVYSFKDPFSAAWIFWYTREASTAVIVTNMPHCWALLRRAFHLKSFMGKGSSYRTRGTSTYGRTVRTDGGGSVFTGTRKDRQASDFALKSTTNGGKGRSFLSSMNHGGKRNMLSLHSRSESQERITPAGGRSHGPALEIWQDVRFQVDTEHNDQHEIHPGGLGGFGTVTDAVALKDLGKASVDSLTTNSKSSTEVPSHIPSVKHSNNNNNNNNNNLLTNPTTTSLPTTPTFEHGPSINLPSRAMVSPRPGTTRSLSRRTQNDAAEDDDDNVSNDSLEFNFRMK